METAHYSRRHSSTNRGKSYNPDLQRHGEVFRYKHSGSSGSSSWVLWGPNTFKKSQKSKPSQKCCGVLLASVIFLVLLLVITIAALAIYMGALRIDSQHFELIFDSSFRVVAGDSYDPSLEDSRSSLYKEKFKRYKSMIEKLYNASVLSPAIKYCSVMGFKSGSLIVFYRIILDRRKIPRTLSNVEEVVKSILVDEISSRKALAFKNIKVDEEDIHIKRYFGVSLSSLLDKEDNTTSGAQSEDVSSSVNTDDNTVIPQSHSSSPEASQPNSSLNSKRKYSTSHIQPIVTQNSFEPSELETQALNFDTHSTTLPPHKSVNGSFTIFHKPHFGDVFAAVKKPMSNQKNPVTATTVLPHKRTSTINKYSDLIETANDHVINDSEIDDELIQSTLEALAHNSLLETNKHELKESTKEKIPDSALKSEMSKSTEKLSGVGEAHVVVLPAVSSNQELLLSPYGTLHSKSTTNRPHSSKNKQSNQQNVPPEIVVTTEARKATPSYSHRNGPNQKSNDVQKQIVVLKEKSSSVNPNQQSKRRKNTDLRTSNKNGNLLYSSNITIQRDTEEYDSELKSISSFLKSEFPVLQKIGNLEEVLRAYKMNRTLGDSNKKYNLAPHESVIKRGDMAGMESSHEYQYTAEAPQRIPGHHHSPVVTLLPVRSNVGPGKPLRPRPHLGTIDNIHTTTVISSPISKNDDFDYLDDQENISHKSSISIPNQQKFSQSYPKLEFSSIHSRYNNDSSKDKHVGFLEFLGRFNSESITKKSPLADKVSQTNILKGQNLDYGSLNIRNFLLPNPSNISKHFKDDFSEGLLHRTYLEGSSSFKEDIFPGHNEDDYLATTEESQKVILNTEVVTSTSVKVSYGEGTASYTEETTTRNILKRPKRTEIFNEPKISNTPLLKETEEKIFHSNERPPLIQRRDRTPKMAQDFLLHSNIHKMKFDRSKKKQNVDDDGFNDRTDHGRAPFVVYATSLENNDNLFSYGSEQHKEVLKERDGHLKASAPNKSESTGAGVDDVEKVVLVMSTSNNVSLVNENKTVEDTKDENKVITQSLLSQMVDKLNRVITNESSVSSLKYLIDQISKQHLKQSHHHESETNISTKAIPSSFNFNQVNGIPILTKVYTKLSKSNSTNKERNQTEFHLNINRSECDMNSSFRCGNGECVSIGSRCNQLVDCADGSDENNCSCADFLKSQFLTRKICDGIIDCWDFSDEHECEWCSPGQYICPNSRVCIERTRLCDGIKDCPLGDDEKQCINLFPMETRFSGSSYSRGSMQRRSDRVPGVLYERTDSYPKHVLQDGADSYLQNTLYPVYHDTGLLMIQKQGQWGKLCMNQINNFVMKSLKWKIADLGKVICKSMTFRDLNEIESVADNSNDDSVYYELSTNAINSSAAFKMSLLFEKTKCSQKQVVAVNCSSLECGIRPQANNIWGSVNLTRSMRHSRIVGGANARLGAWPWQAALYKEGEFQCGATLISDQWLLSAGHCFYRAQEDYWVARLGTLRRGTKLPSPYEQLRPISRIILHPQYVDAGFINDISVLKMKSPVQFSSYVRPICLPHPASSFSDGTLCTVVGWGQLFEIGRVFPDTLQEVQLPIISTAECRKRTLFLPLYRVTENMFCAGFERGGRDACLGDSGGPLMCQEPDGRWSLLGVTSNGYGCARANRPGVYTKVANYIPWLHAAMAAAEYNETAWRQHACSGHRCPLGECLSKARVCNGYMECSDGSDEQGCR